MTGAIFIRGDKGIDWDLMARRAGEHLARPASASCNWSPTPKTRRAGAQAGSEMRAGWLVSLIGHVGAVLMTTVGLADAL